MVPKPGMAEERSRAAAKGWLSRAGAKLEELLARDPEEVGPELWRLEASLAEAEFVRRLENFDAAQLAVETVIEEGKLAEDLEKSFVIVFHL